MIQQKVQVFEQLNHRYWLLPNEVQNMLTFYGSFETAPQTNQHHFLIQDFVGATIDKGTKKHNKYQLADKIESRGAQLRFYADGRRFGFFGRCLTEDLPILLNVLSEQLLHPAFPDAEVEKAREQLIAGIKYGFSDPKNRISKAYKAQIYPPNHPLYEFSPQEDLEKAQTVSRTDLLGFYEQHFGLNDFIFTAVGDFEAENLAKQLDKHFGKWHSTHPNTHFDAFGTSQKGRNHIELPDKMNLEVQIGHPVALCIGDEDYLPLSMATYILGGNFSARLMQKVRDEKGLTYGIYGGLSGAEKEHGGDFRVGVTLSQDKLEEGIDATLAELQHFITSGVNEAELEEKKQTLVGTYQVGLGTTAGLASKLLSIAEDGRPLSRIDAYPDLIQALHLDEVNQAIQKHLRFEDLCIWTGGTMRKD